MFSFWTRIWSGTFRCLGAKFQMARMPLLIEQIAHALRLLGRDGDDADLDLLAAADLAEARQVHDGLAALGGADDGVVLVKGGDDIQAVFREAGVAQQGTAKLACADQHGVVRIAVAEELLDIGDQSAARL